MEGYAFPSDLTSFLFSTTPWTVYVEKANAQTGQDLVVHMIVAVDVSDSHFLSRPKTLQLKVLIRTQLPPKLIGTKWVPAGVGTKSNRNVRLRVLFEKYHGPLRFKTFSPECIDILFNLSVAKDRSDLIKQRIQTWDIYLQLLKDKAKEQEAKLQYHSYRISDNHRKITFKCDKLQKTIENKKLNQASVRMLEEDPDDNYSDFDGVIIGNLDHFQNNEIIVELDDFYYSVALRNNMKFKKKGYLVLSNIGELAQANRLWSGIQKLKNGKALNPRIEDILFGDLSTSRMVQKREPLTERLRHNLNEFQLKAVEGALQAEDIFLIQGPPGTGKTTVIAEICYQNEFLQKAFLPMNRIYVTPTF